MRILKHHWDKSGACWTLPAVVKLGCAGETVRSSDESLNDPGELEPDLFEGIYTKVSTSRLPGFVHITLIAIEKNISTSTTTKIHLLELFDVVALLLRLSACAQFKLWRLFLIPTLQSHEAGSIKQQTKQSPRQMDFQGGSNQYFYVWGHFQSRFQIEKFLHGVWFTWDSPFDCSSQLMSAHLVVSISIHVCLNSLCVCLSLVLLCCKVCVSSLPALFKTCTYI